MASEEYWTAYRDKHVANPEHLAVLKQGVAGWNAWRATNPHILPDLKQADLSKIDLRDANLQGADLHLAFLNGAKLQRAELRQATLQQADLQEANLQRAILLQSELYDTNLHGANLEGVMLFRAELITTNLQEANLQKADLRRAYFQGAFLQKCKLDHALIGGTVFADLDLRDVQGLDKVEHLSPSHISIDTFYRSQGQIPEIFLRGCGVPDSMIKYARSLVAAQRPIDYYSVFTATPAPTRHAPSACTPISKTRACVAGSRRMIWRSAR